jgi:centromere protein S
MTSFLDPSERAEQLEKSIHYSVGRIVQYKAKDRASSGFINALSTLIVQFTTKIVARDLVAFQTHAHRATISEDDVILIARKMPKAYQHLNEYKERELGISAKPKKTSTKK